MDDRRGGPIVPAHGRRAPPLPRGRGARAGSGRSAHPLPLLHGGPGDRRPPDRDAARGRRPPRRPPGPGAGTARVRRAVRSPARPVAPGDRRPPPGPGPARRARSAGALRPGGAHRRRSGGGHPPAGRGGRQPVRGRRLGHRGVGDPPRPEPPGAGAAPGRRCRWRRPGGDLPARTRRQGRAAGVPRRRRVGPGPAGGGAVPAHARARPWPSTCPPTTPCCRSPIGRCWPKRTAGAWCPPAR